jgi:hypothetical protein
MNPHQQITGPGVVSRFARDQVGESTPRAALAVGDSAPPLLRLYLAPAGATLTHPSGRAVALEPAPERPELPHSDVTPGQPRPDSDDAQPTRASSTSIDTAQVGRSSSVPPRGDSTRESFLSEQSNRTSTSHERKRAGQFVINISQPRTAWGDELALLVPADATPSPQPPPPAGAAESESAKPLPNHRTSLTITAPDATPLVPLMPLSALPPLPTTPVVASPPKVVRSAPSTPTLGRPQRTNRMQTMKMRATAPDGTQLGVVDRERQMENALRRRDEVLSSPLAGAFQHNWIRYVVNNFVRSACGRQAAEQELPPFTPLPPESPMGRELSIPTPSQSEGSQGFVLIGAPADNPSPAARTSLTQWLTGVNREEQVREPARALRTGLTAGVRTQEALQAPTQPPMTASILKRLFS